MKYVRFALVVFFVTFAFADLVLAGACCQDEQDSASDTICFCCCSHIIVEHSPEVISERLIVPAVQSTLTHSIAIRPAGIYHPPRCS